MITEESPKSTKKIDFEIKNKLKPLNKGPLSKGIN
jgi:hypothetical protein